MTDSYLHEEPVTRERLIEALVVAKCARFMMGTCYSAEPDTDKWCAVCRVLDDLGYEAYTASSGGLQSWRTPS